MINKLLLSDSYSYIRKLDYYVLKAFLFALFISVMALLGLYIVIHFFTNISDFIEITQQNIFTFIPKYYLIRLPIILGKLISIMVLIAVMITVSRLMKTRELIAMLSAGVGVHRIVLPIFIAVLVLIGLMYYINETVTPYLSKYLTITEKILKSEGSDRFLSRQVPGYQFTIKKYDYVKQQMHSVWVNQYDQANNLTGQIIADEGEWTDKKSTKGWMLYNGTSYSYDAQGFRSAPSQSFQKEGFLLASELTPQSIEKVEESSAYMNSVQVSNLIASQPNNLALQVQYYSKLTDPLIILILMFLGLPFAMAGKSQNFFTGIGICLVASLGFFLVKFLMQGLGNKGVLPSLLAVVLPLLVFGGIGIILSRRIRT